ncbi:MAG: ATP-binding protein [Candidatus Helarchaeota archaeon]
MAIHLKQINARGLGPLEGFTQELGLVNLIYGLNEHGKTFLVEFLIRSLFDNHKNFKLRGLTSSGKVSVSGLADQEISFSPKSRIKLGSYLEDFGMGLPTDFSKLLVVKGADLDFDSNIEGGMDKNSIKAFLSSEEILNRIKKEIPVTIQKATINNGIVQGERRGKMKTRGEIKESIDQLDSLYGEISKKVSGSSYSRAMDEKKLLDNQISLQEQAKQHKAFVLSAKLSQKKNEFDEYKRKKFDDLVENYHEYFRQKNDQLQTGIDLENAKDKSINYEWLNNAQTEYERLTKVAGEYKKTGGAWKWVLFGGGLVSIIVGAVLSMVEQTYIFCMVPGLVALIISGLLIYYYDKADKDNFALQEDMDELKNLKEEFLERIGQKLSSKTSIITAIEGDAKFYYLIDTYESSLKETKRSLEDLSLKIQSSLSNFNSQVNGEEDWEHAIDDLKMSRSSLDVEIRNSEKELSKLNISEEKQLEEFNGVEFSESILADLRDHLDLIEEEIRNEESEFNVIRNKAIAVLNFKDDPTWEDVLSEIQIRNSSKRKEYKETCSDIIAGFVVNQVVDEIKSHEDEKIKRALSLPNITAPIMEVTDKYEGISLEGDKIMVNSSFEDFYLSDLSTGAREQVLLGIRLGLISKLFGNNKGFLILDDAFQHSDYERRKKLVNKMFRLAESNWQILYFSMDDHIASLFDKNGKKLGKDYLRINI